jgi:hypothetical protein
LNPSEEQLFSCANLSLVAPWLSREICRELAATGLFTPRMLHGKTDPESPHMNLYDLIVLTAIQQLLRSRITVDQLRQALYTPANFRCDEFPDEDLIFLTTGGMHGQELSRFLEVTNADVTILVRVPLVGGAEIEIIPNELLGAKDYKGETMTVVDCKAIRDIIRDNIASAEPLACTYQNDGQIPPSA